MISRFWLRSSDDIRKSVWYFGIATWAALGIWFCAGAPWL